MKVTTQQPTIFARSPLWQLQRKYFQEANINAWRNGDVPHYITSNPHMANAYAQLLLAFFRDLHRQGKTQETIYIVELGTGSGRFSYHLIKSLLRLLENALFDAPDFVYVMTDFVEETLQFWDSHLRLQEFFAQGLLDYALFDAEKDSTLHLRKTNRVLQYKCLKQPIVVIANYFFDSIPQDLFYFDKGQVKTALVNLQGYESQANTSAKAQLENIQLEYTYEPIPEVVLGNPKRQKIFDSYLQELNDSHLLFPNTGIECIERLTQLSQEGALIITADKAVHHLEHWQNRPAPYIAKHGSFSLTANYHALKEHCLISGGKPLFPLYPTSSITVAAMLYIKEHTAYKETVLCYQNQVNDFGPDEYFSIKKHIEQQITILSVRELFAYIRLSNYDSRLFHQFLPRFQELVPELNEDERFAMLQLIAQVWEGYYPLAEDTDLAFEIGLLLLDLYFFHDAIGFFTLSERIYGPKEGVLFAQAAAFTVIGESIKAIDLLNTILKKNPVHEMARELLQELQQDTPPPLDQQ
ncbi:MAG TPA: hypothetical protein DCS93_37505 [Microscillaceae bacterium]|nr:hypothetical protein [Microscillaceae bacterium]